MPFAKFLLYNFLGAVTWASVMVSLAFFAGKVISLEQLVAWVSQFAIAALIIVVALITIPLWLESRQIKTEGGE